ADLEDLDAHLRQALRIERHGHAQGGLGDAILAAVHAGGVGGNRGDEGDAAFAGLGHPARRLLGEEVGALQVGRDQLVEALFGGLQQVASLARGHAGVVDQQVEFLKPLAGEGEQPSAILAAGDLALKNLAAGRLAQGIRRVLTPAPGGNHPVSFRQLGGDGAADSTAAAGNNCRQFHQNRVALSSTKVSRVSDGTRTRWPPKITCEPAPAAAPAPAPMAAPLPPPAMAPMMAPATAVPPATFAVFSPCEALSFLMLCVLISTKCPLILTDCSESVRSARPVSLPESLESTSLTTASAPRGITVSPSTITG